MASLYEVGCGTGSGNIGKTLCDYNIKRIIAHIAAPKGASIPASALVDYPSLLAFLKTKVQATLYKDRWFILGRWKANENQGSETNFYTFAGDNTRIADRKATSAGRFQHNEGQCYQNQLIRTGGNFASGYDFFRIDNDGAIIGVAPIDSTTNIYSFQGAALSMFFANPTVNADNSTGISTYFVDIEYADVSDVNENAALIKLDGATRLLADLQPLTVKDVRLDYAVASTPASGVYVIRPQVGCGGSSLAELVPAVAATTYWDITNTTTGAAITATAIVVDPTNAKNIKFTLDTTDTDYPVPPAKITFKLKGLGTVLTPIGAYESNALSIPAA